MMVVPFQPGAGLEAIRAEQDLIGAVLFEPVASRFAEGVQPSQFFEPVHGEIWEELTTAAKGGGQLPPSVLAQKLGPNERFKALGGLGYLADLMDKAPPSNTVGALAGAVVEAWQGRELQASAAAAAMKTRQGEPVAPLLASLKADLERIQTAAGSADELADAPAAKAAALAELMAERQGKRPAGLRTGLSFIDVQLGGLRPGWLITIGGRPGMGKTALMRNIADGAARRNLGQAVLFISLEMSQREIIERGLSAASFAASASDAVSYRDINGQMDERDLSIVSGQTFPANLILADHRRVTVETVRRLIWRVKARRPVGAVFIDYLQLLGRPDMRGRNEASVIGEMTAELKRIAAEAEICIVLGSQLNRQVENREDKRPQLSDLRESGAIEQDSNAVVFPFRPVHYLQREEPSDPKAVAAWRERVELERRRIEIIIAKNRQGPTGTHRLECFIEYDAIFDQRGR